MADKIRTYLPSVVLTLLCVVGYLLPGYGIGEDQPWYHALLFHFSHANIFHLAGNLWFLLWFKPRWSTAAVSYVIASLVALIPLSWSAMPTVGLSALLFAAVARSYVTWGTNILPIIGINLLLSLLPAVNGKIHIISFLTAYIVWKIVSLQKKK